MLKMMRNKTFVLIVIGIALTGFIATLFMSGKRGRVSQVPIGKIGKEDITPREFEAMWDKVRSSQYGNRELSSEERGLLPKHVWDALVDEKLLSSAFKELGLEASDSALVVYMMNNPHPSMQNAEIFMTNGHFDIRKYKEIITSPGFYENEQNDAYMKQVERETRSFIWPNIQLQTLLMAGKTPSKSEVAEVYSNENSKVQYEYISPLPGVLMVEPTEISDEQVAEYLKAHKEDYISDKEQVSLYITRLSKVPTSSDEEVIKAYLTTIRDSIMLDSTQGFAAFAYESDDEALARQNGSLGWLPRGFSEQFRSNRMIYPIYKKMEDIAFSLKEGEVSMPFTMGPAISIIGVDSIKVEGDSVVAVKLSQIVKNIVPSQAKLDSLATLADSIRSQALASSLQEATQKNGVSIDSTELYTKGALVPLIGYAEGLGAFVFDGDTKIGSVSPVFENENGYYVVSLRSKVAPGKLAENEYTTMVRRILSDSLSIEKKSAYLAQALASYSSSESLLDFAQKDSLLVAQITDTISPNQYVSGIGSNSAASEVALITPLETLSKRITTDFGAVVVRPLYQAPASIDSADASAYNAIAQRLRMAAVYDARSYNSGGPTKAYTQWIESYRKRIGVKSDVAKFYN